MSLRHALRLSKLCEFTGEELAKKLDKKEFESDLNFILPRVEVNYEGHISNNVFLNYETDGEITKYENWF